MANIMNNVDFRNSVSRNGFDQSHKVAFTAKTGELLPFHVQECIPGEKYNIKLQGFTRTQPLNTAAYTRIREYYDYYFVPYRLLWRYAPDFLTQMPNSNSAYSETDPVMQMKRLPYFSMYELAFTLSRNNSFNQIQGTLLDKNMSRTSRLKKMRKLLSYLGYGVMPSYVPTAVGEDSTSENLENAYYDFIIEKYYKYDVAVNPFPILAYQKVYNDYFRDQQWERSNPQIFNIDYVTTSGQRLYASDYIYDGLKWDQPTMFDLQYCNWHKDMFTGVLPQPQFGDTAAASPLTGSFAAQLEFGGDGFSPTDINEVSITPNVSSQYNQSGLSVLALRQAEFLQKWKEISQSGRQDYKDQIQKHFNVEVSDTLSNRCKFLGGIAQDVSIDGVTNTNLSDGGVADIKGIGTSSQNGSFDYEPHEHGIIIGIYHNVPLLDYQDTRLSPLVCKIDATDFAIPEMDKLGMQPVYLENMQYGSVDVISDDKTLPDWEMTDKIIGYAPRYIDYKTATDVVRGEFLFTLKSWVAPINTLISTFTLNIDSFRKLMSYQSFKVNPTVLDPIFLASAADDGTESDISKDPLGTTNDQFLINTYIEVKKVAPLDYNGLPY